MKIKELFSVATGLRSVQGVEKDLRLRKRRGALAGLGALGSQVVILAANGDYLTKVGHFSSNLVHGRWDRLLGGEYGLDGYELLALVVLIVGVATFTVLRNTRIALAQTTEPFRYTFSVAPLTRVGSPGVSDGPLRMLYSDLIDRLSREHPRLSLLDVSVLKPAERRRLSSHIHIGGDYILREPSQAAQADGDSAPTTIEVLPRVRIGSPDEPERVVDRASWQGAVPHDGELPKAAYDHLIEQVKSHIEKVMYAQILMDVGEKVRLYPSTCRRAVGLFYEAEDFERSNTIDAYDHALSLYRQAIRQFDLRPTRSISRLLLRYSCWHLVHGSLLLEAKARVAFSRCLILRRLTSATSGTRQNPIFEVKQQLDECALPALVRLHECVMPRARHSGECRDSESQLIADFLTYSQRRRAVAMHPLVEKCREVLFEGYVVAALAQSVMREHNNSRKYLGKALATAPDIAAQSALYFLAQSRLEGDLTKKQRLLQRAKELAPKSETIAYSLAEVSHARLLRSNDLSEAAVKVVIDALENVQQINPGNIAAYAACGNTWWLIDELENAGHEYQQGLDEKAIQREAFIGELTYGQARIAAEQGDFDRAYKLFQEAIDANPGVASCRSDDPSLAADPYSLMTSCTLARYEKFLKNVRDRHADLQAAQPEAARPKLSERTCNTVLGFALNDCANAQLTRYLRSGLTAARECAIALYEEAAGLAPNLAVVYFNQSCAYSWRWDFSKQVEAVERAHSLAPSWNPWLVELLEQYLRKRCDKQKEFERQRAELDSEVCDLNEQADALEREVGQISAEAQAQRDKAKREDKQRGCESARAIAEVERVVGNVRTFGNEQGVPLRRAAGTAGRSPGKVQQELRPCVSRPAPNEAFSRDALPAAKKRELDATKSRLECAKARKSKLEEEQPRSVAEADRRVCALLEKVLASSRFAAFFRTLDDRAFYIDKLGPRVAQLLERPKAHALNVGHVDEDFVRLLFLLARVLSIKKEHVELSKQLYGYLLKEFGSEDFMAHCQLLELFGEPNVEETPEQRSARCESAWIVHSAIEADLAEDTTRWIAFVYASDFWQRELVHVNADIESGLVRFFSQLDEKATKLDSPERSRLKELGLSLSVETTARCDDGKSWLVEDREAGRDYRFALLGTNPRRITIRFAQPNLISALERALNSPVDAPDGPHRALLHELLASQYADTDQRAAIKELEAAARCDTEDPHYLCRLGECHSKAGDYEQACEAYRNAIVRSPRDSLAYELLEGAEQHACGKGVPVEQLENSLQALQRLGLSTAQYPLYAQRIANLERELLKVRRKGEAIENDFGVVKPVVIELGSDLVRVVDPAREGGDFIPVRVEAMREALAREFGISLPGLHFRGSPSLGSNGYKIMIDEAPIATGQIVVPAGAANEESPRNENILLQRVEAVLRRQLALLFGLDEAVAWLDRCRADEACAGLIPPEREFVSLSRVLRALLAEQIPLVDARTILRTLHEVGLEMETIADAVHVLRLRLKRSLLGNAADAIRIELPQALAESVATVTRAPNGDGRGVPPLTLHRTIVDMDKLWSTGDPHENGHCAAIVLPSAKQRDIAKRVFEASFPDLVWLSRDELLNDSQESAHGSP